MTKAAKGGKKASVKKNPDVHARLSHLFESAKYLTTTLRAPNHSKPTTKEPTQSSPSDDGSNVEKLKGIKNASSRFFLSQLRGVSLKGQVRIDQAMKRSICRRCNNFLIEEVTSSSTIENRSRGGKKPWANVKLVTCSSCGSEQRYPNGARRQAKKNKRHKQSKSQTKGEN